MAEVSFFQFLEEEHEDVAVDDIVTLDCFPYWSQIYGSDSDSLSPRHPHHHPIAAVDDDIFATELVDWIPRNAGSGANDRKNQVNFVIDLLHQRVEQSHVMGSDEFVSEPVNELSFGVIDDNDELGINYLDIELGLGLGLGGGVEFDGISDGDGDYTNGGFIMSDCGDEFFVSRRENRNGDLGNSSRVGGLRIVGIDSDSEEEEGNDLLGIDVHSEEEDYGVDNVNDDDISIPLCWDLFQLEDHVEGNNDFEWEEVDGRVDEREVLSIVADLDEEGSISVLHISGPEEDGVGERGRGLGNLDWEVLLNVNNLDRNPEMENGDGPYFGDHDFYTADYEMMFGQFGDDENSFLGRPPASKSVVERLPSVVMTEEDVVNEKALCAVCKDQIGVGNEGKQLPCSHRYHGDCIVPWLGIRNTCPVCRYELPTEDPEYEQRRVRRAALSYDV